MEWDRDGTLAPVIENFFEGNVAQLREEKETVKIVFKKWYFCPSFVRIQVVPLDYKIFERGVLHMRTRAERKQNNQSQANQMMNHLRQTKAATLQKITEVGRRNKKLVYPILILLVPFLFLYNLMIYAVGKSRANKGLSRAMAFGMAIAVMVTAIPLTHYANSFIKAATIGNNKYPYLVSVSDGQIKLAVDCTNASSYSWYVASEKNGNYEAISGANGQTYTFAGRDGYWYKCKVDSTFTEPVQTVSTRGEVPFRRGSSTGWYIGNGSMAYTLVGSEGAIQSFDVVGLYQGSYIQTSYGANWGFYTSSETNPQGVNYYSATMASLSNVKVSFQKTNAFQVDFRVGMPSGQKSFAIETDVQINTNDRAPVKAIIKNNKIEQIGMVSGSYANPRDDDAAFAITPQTAASEVWIDDYSAVYVWDSKTYDSGEYTHKEATNYKGKNVLSLYEGGDSGMSVSWENLSTSEVVFSFGVGSLADVGFGISTSADYESGVVTGLDQNGSYVITVGSNKYYFDNIPHDYIQFVGKDSRGTAYDFRGKTLNIVQIVDGKESEPSELQIETKPNTPPVVQEAKVTVDSKQRKINIETAAGQEYICVPSNITIDHYSSVWNHALSANGSISFTSDSTGAAFDVSKQYVVYTRVAATSSTPWSDISAKTSEFRFHEHHWNYYAQGNAIYAYCDGEIYQEDCAYIGRNHAMALTLNEIGTAVYTGRPIVATITNPLTGETGKSPSNVRYYKGSEQLASAPTRVGTYRAEVTYENLVASIDFSIVRADQNATISISDYTFDGEVSTPVIRNVKENAEVTFYYNTTNSNVGGTPWTELEKDTLDPGTYFVYATLTETENYNVYTTTPFTFTINRATLGVTAEAYVGTYDGQNHGISVNVGAPAEGATITYSTSRNGIYTETPVSFKDVETGEGTYTVYYKIEARGYETVYGSSTVVIEPKEVGFIWDDSDLVYNQTEQLPRVIVDPADLIDGDECQAGLTNAGSNVGEYEAQIVSLSNPNYKLPENRDDCVHGYRVVPKAAELLEVQTNRNDNVYVMTRGKISPEIVIVDGDRVLTEGVDYILSGDLSADAYGTYRVIVQGIGNYDETQEIVWQIDDPYEPSVSVSLDTKVWNHINDGTRAGLFFNTNCAFVIKGSDGEKESGLASLGYYKSETKLNVAQLGALTPADWTAIGSGKSVMVTPDQTCYIYAKAVDAAGNISYAGSDNVVLDATLPVISGISSNTLYCENPSFTVSDSNLAAVKVNGSVVSPTADGTYILPGNGKVYTITVADRAGNVVQLKNITVYSGHSYAEYEYDDNATTGANATEHAYCEHCGYKDVREVEGTKIERTTENSILDVKKNEKGGELYTTFVGDKDAGSVELGNFDTELASNLLDEEEMQAYRDGNKVEVFMEAVALNEKQVPERDGQQLKNFLTRQENGMKFGHYLDLSLFKRIYDAQGHANPAVRITDTRNSAIMVVVTVPRNLWNVDTEVIRTFGIVRVHDGVAENLAGKYNERNHTITFYTSKFSTYALTYVDEMKANAPTMDQALWNRLLEQSIDTNANANTRALVQRNKIQRNAFLQKLNEVRAAGVATIGSALVAKWTHQETAPTIGSMRFLFAAVWAAVLVCFFFLILYKRNEDEDEDDEIIV